MTPSFHALHDAWRRSPFALFTTVLEHAFGSVEPDCAQARVATASGQPLQR